MKYLIFSDSHLTDHFEEEKFKFLKRIINAAERVIINGDFWDGYITSFDNFVKSDWKDLFPLLRQKKTVYLYGNHDRKKFADDRVNLFSDYQQDQFKLISGNLTFKIEHGNRIFMDHDKLFPRKIASSIIKIISDRRYKKFISDKKELLNFYKNQNHNFKKIPGIKSTFLIFGHSHGAEISEKHKFANSGFIRWGYASYLIVEDGKIILKVEEY